MSFTVDVCCILLIGASDPVGYGFVIHGNSPVYVHSVDPMGPAAAAGLNVSDLFMCDHNLCCVTWIM